MADDEPFPESIENAWGSDHVNIEKGGDYIIEDEKRLPFIYRKVLGNGLSAVVEKVQHTITKEVFAKKVIKLPRLKSKGRESAEEHYQNEVAIIRGLSQHSHIIELFATYMTPRSGVLLLRPAAEEGDLQHRLGSVVRATYNAEHLQIVEQQLDPDFKVRSAGFFTEGRMFSVLFIEPAGANTVNNVTYYNGNLSQVQYGEYARSQVRRFIVVKQRREYCFAVPVFTYGNRGTRKPGVVADEHAIAHSHGSSPMLVADEAPLTKSPIPIVMNVSEESLSLASRIYFGIHHPIQFNVKVKDIGRVHPDWLPTFLGYWKMENGKDSQQSPDLTRDPANHETS
ncbi:unnamed protein product [Alternaria alternata]